MMVVFEVFLAPGADPGRLISEELKQETQAQVMTLDEARKVGFNNLQDPPGGTEVRLIAVAERDRKWIQRMLETNEVVGPYRVHEVE